jgi:hypothetical protein
MSHAGRWRLSRDEAPADCGQHAKLPAATSSKVRVIAKWRNEMLLRLGGRFILHKSLNQKVRPNQREGVMVPVISANALLVWFVWGFFMAIGWALGTWVVARLLGMVWRERP